MKKYTISQAGCGHRGKHHLKGILGNPDRFEIVGLCDINEEMMKNAASSLRIEAPMYQDAEVMLAENKPDVFSFVTHPDIRLSFVELAIKYGVKAIAFEKPMATSLREAKRIADLCSENGVKAVVCHQQKYLPSMQKLKAFIDNGEIGKIEKIHISTLPWLSQLGTHFMDYALWLNGGKRGKWVVGHVHGKQKLSDDHPSSDFANGTVLLENGVRIYMECGYLSEKNLPDEDFWVDNRLTAYGTNGYAWAETNGRWAALTKSSNGELLTGQEGTWLKLEPDLQIPYYADLADWLDDDRKIHPCNVEISRHGYEILEGICISALDNIRIDIPIENSDYEDVNERMRKVLPEIKTY